MIDILKLDDCERCKGAGMLIQTEGALKGVVRPCPNCASDYKKYINKYGSDSAEHPIVFIDNRSRPVVQKVDRKKDYLIINGKLYYRNIS